MNDDIHLAELRDHLRTRIRCIATFQRDGRDVGAEALHRSVPNSFRDFIHHDDHTIEEIEAWERLLDRIEADLQMPFGSPRPGVDDEFSSPEPPARRTVRNEGLWLRDDHPLLTELREQVAALSDEQASRVRGWTKAAHAAGLSLSLSSRPTERKALIGLALCALSVLDDDTVLNTLNILVPASPGTLGTTFGALTIAHATELRALAEAILFASAETVASGSPR